MILIKKYFRLLILSAISFLFFSCKFGLNELFYREYCLENRASEMKEVAVPFTSTTASPVENYSFVIITDTHFENKSGRSCDNSFYEWLFNLQTKPLFCICLGDVANFGFSENFDVYNKFIKKMQTDYKMPVYTIVGNHDLYNSGWNSFKKKIFPYTSFYHFETKSFSWYFLDTGNGEVGSIQYKILKTKMEKDSKPKLVFMHYPLFANGDSLFCMEDTTERNMLVTLFEKNNVKYDFVGHTHKYSRSEIGSFVELNVPGLHDKSKWALVTVDENNKSLSVQIVP